MIQGKQTPPAKAENPGVPVKRRPWTSPKVEDLPPLRDLTLQTGLPIGGGESVFP